MSKTATSPLAQWLGDDWSRTDDAETEMATLTHKDGLWVEIESNEEFTEAQAAGLGEALNEAIKGGMTGYAVITPHKDDGKYTFWIEQPQNEKFEHKVVR